MEAETAAVKKKGGVDTPPPPEEVIDLPPTLKKAWCPLTPEREPPPRRPSPAPDEPVFAVGLKRHAHACCCTISVADRSVRAPFDSDVSRGLVKELRLEQQCLQRPFTRELANNRHLTTPHCESMNLGSADFADRFRRGVTILDGTPYRDDYSLAAAASRLLHLALRPSLDTDILDWLPIRINDVPSLHLGASTRLSPWVEDDPGRNVDNTLPEFWLRDLRFEKILGHKHFTQGDLYKVRLSDMLLGKKSLQTVMWLRETDIPERTLAAWKASPALAG